MYRELNLRIPGALLFSLERRATEQGLSLDELCLSLLSGQELEKSLVNPDFYSSLSHSDLRNEIRLVIESGLPSHETRKRVNALQFLITKRYIR